MEFPIRLATVLLVTSLAVSTGAQAVSLSDAQLRSRLGQRLDLRMELQHAKGEAPSVSLATAAEYARLGIDPPSRQMGELTVEREVIAEGREQIRVRSSSRVSEPILTLLLEVREGNTRLIREFTTFVDPPAGTTLPDAEPAAAAAPPVSPLLSALALEPTLPSVAPVRTPRAARTAPESAFTPAKTTAPTPLPAVDRTPLPRFRLDERYESADAGPPVVIAAATAAWLHREFGVGEKQAPVAAAAPAVRLRSEPAATTTAARLPTTDAPPPPWRSFLILVGVTVGICAYARRLRQRLMREAAVEMSLEKAAA
ncbi:MAG TPA: hypothetical protein VGE22_03415 [Solimonas sp.]